LKKEKSAADTYSTHNPSFFKSQDKQMTRRKQKKNIQQPALFDWLKEQPTSEKEENRLSTKIDFRVGHNPFSLSLSTLLSFFFRSVHKTSRQISRLQHSPPIDTSLSIVFHFPFFFPFNLWLPFLSGKRGGKKYLQSDFALLSSLIQINNLRTNNDRPCPGGQHCLKCILLSLSHSSFLFFFFFFSLSLIHQK
jgi:hypothetical protein